VLSTTLSVPNAKLIRGPIEQTVEPDGAHAVAAMKMKVQVPVFPATVLKVLIATPGDTAEEVEAIMKSLHSWNSRRAEAEGVVLLPRHWKSDAVPLMSSNGPQSVIDS